MSDKKPNEYRKSFLLQLLTEEQVEQAQEVAQAGDKSVADVLADMMNKIISNNPAAARLVAEAQDAAVEKLATLIAGDRLATDELDEIEPTASELAA